jgi:glycerol kinase
VLDPYFSATKLEWLLNSVPDARSRAANGELAFGTVDSWLIFNLSKGASHVIDETNASRTLLYNIHTQDWDDSLLRLFYIPRAVLPRIVQSRLERPFAIELAHHELPLGGIAGDQQAAMVGQACFTRGMAKNTYGTGCFALLHTGEEAFVSQHRLLTTVACRTHARPCFALEGAVFVGGALVQWLRDELRIIETAADIEPLARSVPDSGGVAFVPAFTGLGSPHWDPLARGMIAGLTRGSTRAHIARAALDAIALQSAEVLLAMQRDAGFSIRELRVDGGAAVNDLLMQTQADLLGLPVIRPKMIETTALGAAYLSGLSAGLWSSPEAIAAQWRADRVFEPSISRDAAESRLARWSDAVRRASGWAEPG